MYILVKYHVQNSRLSYLCLTFAAASVDVRLEVYCLGLAGALGDPGHETYELKEILLTNVEM